MNETIDSRFHQIFGVCQIEHVRNGAHIVLVSFIDDCAINFRLQFGHAAHVVVDPHLDEVDFFRGLIAHSLAGFNFRRYLDRDVAENRRPTAFGRNSAPGREEPRAASLAFTLLVADLKRDVTGIATQHRDGGNSIVGVPVQIGQNGLAFVVFGAEACTIVKPSMPVKIEENGHDRPAFKIHASRALGRLHVLLLPDSCELSVLDDEAGVLKWGSAVPGNQAGSGKEGDVGHCWTRCLRLILGLLTGFGRATGDEAQ